MAVNTDGMQVMRNAVKAGDAAVATDGEKTRRIAELEAALKPFAEFAIWVGDNGWTSTIHREPISVWFGPSDFREAAAAMAKK